MQLSMESKLGVSQMPHLVGADRSSTRWVREGFYKFSFELRKYAMLSFCSHFGLTIPAQYREIHLIQHEGGMRPLFLL